jgi:signal transduction histidine kinase/DNA-binding response OmpR family regulator
MAARLTISLLSLLLATAIALWLRERARYAQLQVQLQKTTRDYAVTLSARNELDTVKDEFVSTVSHELRTPLTSIRGALGLLSNGMVPRQDTKAQNLLRIALTNTDRLIRLINDILDLERLQSGGITLHILPCSVYEMSRRAVDGVALLAETEKVFLDVQIREQDAPMVDCDADRIGQVLTNLLSNAIKFSPPNAEVRVTAESRETTVLLRVIDQGRGIPEEKLESIFERFQQVESSDARQKGGTGLGLAICKSIVEKHGGRIWAEPNVGLGSIFCVELPHSAGQQAVILPAMSSSLSGDATVLVCDDDAGIRAIVREHLEQHGYTVVEVARGEQALTVARQHKVAAILLDLYMPGLSGWETLQQLHNDPSTAEIPVVILSVLSPSEKSQIAAGVQGWVQKPFNEDLLLGELGRVLHGSSEGMTDVLLVEDDDDLAEVVIAGFERAGVTVRKAATRQAAIAACNASRPDLLILDLTLPDGDGFSLVEWLRTQPGLRSIPIVVYSGQEVSDPEMAKLQLGPTQFLTKAKVQPQEVEALVLAMLRDSQKKARI